MGLKIWLPLNGDIKNKGSGNISITQSPVTVSNSGKIGKSYYFSGTDSFLYGTQDFIDNNIKDWTIACWVKLDSGKTDFQAIFGCSTENTYNNLGVFIKLSGAWVVDDGKRWTTETKTLNANTWYHLCFVRKAGVGKFIYINGVLDSSTTVTGTPTKISPTNFTIGTSMNNEAPASGTTNMLKGYMNDFRFYNQALSAAEIKELAKGLVFHYKLDYISNTIPDSSGNGYTGIKNGTLVADSSSPRYSLSTNFNKTGHIINSNFSARLQEFTLNMWVYPRAATAQHFLFGTFNTWIEDGIGIFRNANGTAYNIRMKSDLEDTYLSKTITCTLNTWNMITIVYTGTICITYLNGNSPSSTTYGLNGTVYNGNIMVGNSKYHSTPDSENEEALISDVRFYSTALSAEDILSLYNTSAKISNNSTVLGYEIKEDGNTSHILKQGIIKSGVFSETFISPFDTNFYIEPDNTVWIRLTHHNNPTNARFSSTDPFDKSVYLNVDRWFYASIVNKITNNTYEFMIKQKKTSTGTEEKYRWIQTVNPYTAVFEDVDAADVTKITDGYDTVNNYGGIYKLNNNSYFVANNSNKGNWYGAIGCWNVYNSGIPAYGGGAVTTGYLDLYLRVDNQINDIASIFTNSIIASSFIES